MVEKLEIYPPDTHILDGMTFCVDFAEASIEGGHLTGPVFAYQAAKAVLSTGDAERLAR
ncbi:hypothetical protein [Cupriavidus sp. UME77]|uniref:hypothetical protein n=1 Tax=Cupriavidus sp. UME77 TaxID=1862321 RepID=UPI00160146E0|nr:hypothetical protein [Cupriavidus sp. UME77]